MRIGIDLDLTFCTDYNESGGVMKCTPLEGAKEAVTHMRMNGHQVIFFTHRGQHLRGETVEWLRINGIRYDGIVFEKPHFDLYIGDEAEKFTTWNDITVKI